ESLARARLVLVEFPDTPDNLALMQGLYYYSGSYINIPINGNPLDPDYIGLVNAYGSGDEEMLRKRLEEVINLIVGDQSDLYKDYDGDGIINTGDGDGYGSLPNGTNTGYLQATISHVKDIADASDSTPNMRTYSGNIQTCIQNMATWSDRVLELATELNGMSMGDDMEAIVAELSQFGRSLVRGDDVNGNGLVEPIEGECGADIAYEHGWYMIEMPILIGPDRIPSSGK
ncbi:MAG TPA: hypothetical protein VMJ90_08635, partial [Anaerolineales bacterium]|nr:hypothetical protein [Anaerolineales bacterium]